MTRGWCLMWLDPAEPLVFVVLGCSEILLKKTASALQNTIVPCYLGMVFVALFEICTVPNCLYSQHGWMLNSS